METVRVSSSYRISIPSAVRKQLNIRAGQELRVEVVDGKLCLLPIPDLDDLVGAFPGLTYAGVREKSDRPL